MYLRISVAVMIALAAMLLPFSYNKIEPAKAVGNDNQQTLLGGKWRWEGTDKKVQLLQLGNKLKGSISSAAGWERIVEGTASENGDVEMYEYFPRSASNVPESVWKEVLKGREDPAHPGFLRGKITLSYNPKKNELSGKRTYFTVNWKRSSGEFESATDETEDIKLVRQIGICGPDVTRNTLAVLKQIIKDFLAAGPDVREKACSNLVTLEDKNGNLPPINPPKGALVEAPVSGYAWDILELFGDSGSYPSEKKPEGTASSWEQGSGASCCLPRYPCGKSVVFFGLCHDPQVVNYAMWGATFNLCDQTKTQKVADWARSRKSPDRPDQVLMAEIGEKYGGIVLHYLKNERRYPTLILEYDGLLKQNKRKEAESFLAKLPKEDQWIITSLRTEEALTNPMLFPEIKDMVTRHEGGSDRPTKLCDTVCDSKLSPEQKKKFESLVFKYRWVGLNK